MAEANLEPPATLNIAEYLGPENLSFVSRLSLDPRQRAAGLMVGDHKSPDTGAGLEFAVHRHYVTGDDGRQLDWNLYGRSDRLYIKKYEETTELRGVICLDLSGSMSFGGATQEGRPAKFEVGCLKVRVFAKPIWKPCKSTAANCRPRPCSMGWITSCAALHALGVTCCLTRW